MKTAKEWQGILGIEDKESEIQRIKQIQIDALKLAYEIIMDDAVIYPGKDIRELIEELENETN